MMIPRHKFLASSSSGSEVTGLVLSTGIAAVDCRDLAFEVNR